jgi:DNA polymerase-3 subunit alpha
MRDLLKRLAPSNFGDITAVNALYRPGPLGSGMASDFIDCKHGRKKIKYIHPSLEPILRETYGVILYQEQVMRIASDLAGFSLQRADTLRRAMGKKKAKEMEKQRKAFIEGAGENGISAGKAEKIFDLMAYFSGYGFNKSHSTAYAMVSMQTAFLKANYTSAFMAAAMTSDMGDTNRLIILIDECRNLGIAVHPPDINSGGVQFDLSGDEVTYGLAAVKNVGEKAVRGIVEERRENGPFSDLTDFCNRVDLRLVNRRVVENLIQSGSMDCLPGTRSQKVAAIDRVLIQAQKRQSERESGQTFLGFLEHPSGEDLVGLDNVHPWEESERLHREKESLGFYFSGHPLDRYREIFGHVITMDSLTLPEKKDRDSVVLAGMVTDIRVVMDRKGNPMAFVTIEDFHGSYDVIVFSSCYQTGRERLLKDDLVVIPGKVSIKNGSDRKTVIADKVYTMDEALRYLPHALHLTLREGVFGEKEMEGLRETLSDFSGEKQVVFHWKRDNGEERKIGVRRFGVSPDLEMIDRLKKISGVEHVEVS